MNLRIKTLLMISLILILSLLSGCSLLRGIIPSLPNKEAGYTYYVPDDYSTIQAAVDAASPDDTIIVRDGTYIENVEVNKERLTIKSENGAEVTIVQVANSHDHVFEVTADYVNISGFTVKGATEYLYAGIHFYHVNYCNILDSNVMNNYVGIYLECSNNNMISNNTCYENKEGIVLYADRVILLHEYSNNNKILNNTCYKNIYSGIGLSFYCDSNIISNNTCYENGYHGIDLGWHCENNEIANNTCYSNDGSGIFLGSLFDHAIPNTISNNIFKNNLYGIWVFLSENNIILKNTCENNQYGIYFEIETSYKKNRMYLNNLINNDLPFGIKGSYTGIWNSLEQLTYTYNGNTYTNHLGNYWSDYTGSDANGDGIGNTPYAIGPYGDSDSYPLMKPFENYVIGEAPPVYPGYAIIVAGQGGLREKWLINRRTNYACIVLRELGFNDDNIFYLNDDGHNDVDGGDTTRDNLKEAITERATQRVGPSAPLVLYMVGHGMEVGSFDLNEFEQVLGFELEDWFSALPKETEILIVIDACYSGSFITNPVNSISSKNRVIITSCRADEESYPYISAFSQHFWKYLYLQQGYDVREAFIRASQIPGQGEPQLDDPSGIAPNMIIGKQSGPIIDLERLRWTTLCSPGELRVYDSKGRITGSVNGSIIEEIPDSIYIEESKTVIIWPSIDTYCDEVVGTDAGTYGLTVTSVDEETSVFTATDIPTSKNEIHQYTIDWEALSQDSDGVTVQIDFDGDGTFELTITAGSTFIFVPAAIDIDPDTLNLKSKIKWVTAYIELPEDYDVTNIDVSTVNLWYEGNNVPAEWGDIQDDTLMVKFNGKAVQDLFTGPVDSATVAVAGELQDGTPFGGNDTIRVIKKP